jgi:hypothetical protein
MTKKLKFILKQLKAGSTHSIQQSMLPLKGAGEGICGYYSIFL